jgi:hypothetical protein
MDRKGDGLKRWTAFAHLCAVLRHRLCTGNPPSHRPAGEWELLIEASSHHLVTPALAWCLRGDDSVPSDVRDYLDLTLEHMIRRNEQMLDALERSACALNGAGIVPVLLKGAALLVDGLYPAPGLRILGDLDLLVSADRIQDAATALRNIGFASNDSIVVKPQHHHLPAFRDGVTGAGVELHTKIMNQTFLPLIPASDFAERARPAAFRGLDIRLPTPTGRIAHNIAHGAIATGDLWRNNVNLRQLLDLVMIRTRYENEIDWNEIDGVFCAAGFGRALSTNLHFAEILFGQPAPPTSSPPRSISDLQRAVERSGTRNWGRLAAGVIIHAMQFRRDPMGVLRWVIDLNRLPNRIRRLATTEKRKW